MHLDDAAGYLVDYIRKPRPSDGYPVFGYDFYLANVIASYMVEVEQCRDHPSMMRNSQRASELWPFFSEAAWYLCRRGIFRPGPRLIDGQTTSDTHGYTLTSLGSKWLDERTDALILIEPTRLGTLFASFGARLGNGFAQRANEATRCHAAGCYLACCAMCGRRC